MVRATGRACGFPVHGRAGWLVLAVIAAWLPAAAWAQQPKIQRNLSDPQVRADYVAELTADFELRKLAAEIWAAQHNVATRFDAPDRAWELMDVVNDRPHYYITNNSNAAISTAANLIRNTSPYNVNGADWIVGVWDGGAIRTTHQEFVGRVTIMDGASAIFHATHVGGTVGAAGVVGSAMGMAPSVSLRSFDWNNDNGEMAQQGASVAGEENKIRISNHSYGPISGWILDSFSGNVGWHWFGDWPTDPGWDGFGQYSAATAGLDEIAYNLPYFLQFKSAGNERDDNPSNGNTVYYFSGGWQSATYNSAIHPKGDGVYKNGYDCLSPDSCAKNIMVIGAVNDAVSGGQRNLGVASMTGFSSWGPTDDGRIKPDVVANGGGLFSTSSGSDTDYGTASGTSMSSPNAAGSAILLTELYAETHPQEMRSSTLRGLLIHTADNLGSPGPDYIYGWGLINVQAAADLILEDADSLELPRIIEGLLNGANPSDEYVMRYDGSGPIVVTLCWTDPPGASTDAHDSRIRRLVNDLDLRVLGAGGSPTYMPFVLDVLNPSATATTGDNLVDNVEQVRINVPPASPGCYRIRVSHKGTLTDGQQHYSLIITSSTPPGEDCNANQVHDACDIEQGAYVYRNDSSQFSFWHTGQPIAQDLHFGSAGDLVGYDVTYTTGTSSSSVDMTVAFYANDATNTPRPPAGLLFAQSHSLPTIGGGVLSIDVNPPVAVPQDIWMEVVFNDPQVGPMRVSGGPAVGNSDGLAYNRTAMTTSSAFFRLGVRGGIDENDNGVPDFCEGACTCGDVNGSGGLVDLTDFATFSSCFGLASSTPGCECADLNADGVVNLADFSSFSTVFGTTSAESPPNCN